MEEGVGFFGRDGFVVKEPPVEERIERAGERMGCGAQLWIGEGDPGRDEALFDGTGKTSDGEFAEVGAFAGGGDGGMDFRNVGDVGEEFLDGKEAAGGRLLIGEEAPHHFEEVFDVAEEEVVLIAEVGVEGGATDAGAVEDVLHGDGVEGLLLHELDEGVAEGVSGAADAAVGLGSGAGWSGFGGCVSGHAGLLCSVSVIRA